jgi:predicted nucleic acid-binding protein
VFIAVTSPRAKHYEEGGAILASVEKGVLGKPVVTDHILDEVVTFIRKKKRVQLHPSRSWTL